MTKPKTETVSDVAARRIQHLRQAQGVSAAQLAAACERIGAGTITANTLANIESGRRDNDNDNRRRRDLTVDELFALAFALDVPPVALLIDSTASDVRVTPEKALDPVSALLWAIGEQPQDSAFGSWFAASQPIRLARQFSRAKTGAESALAVLRDEDEGDLPVWQLEAAEKSLDRYLHQLWRSVLAMSDAGLTLPVVPKALVDEATKRGIWNDRG